MRPHSRGTPPIEFSLRVPCELGQQLSLGDTSIPHDFQLCGIRCKATQENGCLLIIATGFPSLQAAKQFFYELQYYIAFVSLNERIAISVPTQLAEPVEADFYFIAEDTRCASHGWPPEPIRPLLISNLGACVYPEHKYVAIDEAWRLVPSFTYSLAAFVGQICTAPRNLVSSEPVDKTLLLAIAGYAHAVRSTQWVWSFLLTVMTLEMLARETSSSNDTQVAVKSLIEYADGTFACTPSVDLERIRSCLRQANTESKTSALKALVRKYCAPGISLSPLTHLYIDAADCDQKVGAIYNVRSKYVHEGRVALINKLKYTFGELHNIAVESLGHILKTMLANR